MNEVFNSFPFTSVHTKINRKWVRRGSNEWFFLSAQLGLALLIGVVTGIVLIALWYIYGMPCIAILQASLSMGALVASTTFFCMSGT